MKTIILVLTFALVLSSGALAAAQVVSAEKWNIYYTADGKPIKNDHIALEVKKVMRKLEYSEEKIHKPLHGGRHAFCSHALASGVPEMIVQSALGHKTNIMTRHYAHLSPEHVREQFDKLRYRQGKKEGE